MRLLRRHKAAADTERSTEIKTVCPEAIARLSTIFGTRPSDGVTPITDELVRGRLGELFAKARMGWREIDLNQHDGRKEERPIEVQYVRRRVRHLSVLSMVSGEFVK